MVCYCRLLPNYDLKIKELFKIYSLMLWFVSFGGLHLLKLSFFLSYFMTILDSVEWPLEIFYHKNLGKKRVFALKVWEKGHARKLEYKVGGLLCNSKYLRDIWIYTIISQYLQNQGQNVNIGRLLCKSNRPFISF